MALGAVKIRLDSNLMREPQVFDQLGDLAGGIARDLLLFAAWNNAQHTRLHVPEFCEMMGYNRKHLMRKITDDQVKELLTAGWHEDDVPVLSNTIGYTLGKMATKLLLFAPPRLATAENDAKKLGRYTNKRMVSAVNLDKRSTGTVVHFEVDNEVLENCRKRYETIDLQEYLSLRTPGGEKNPNGHPDDQARRMYLRLRWKRQFWDSKHNAPGIYPSKDSYRELLAVAGLSNYGSEKLAASKLRKLLERIGAMPSIMMIPRVTLNHALGVYEVTWARKKMKGSKAAGQMPAEHDDAPAAKAA